MINYYFKTVNEMKNFTGTLNEGDICETGGYHQEFDGGRAKYTVAQNADGLTSADDNGAVIVLSNNKIAKIITEGKPVSILQFGAISDYSNSDSARDDSVAIQNAINFTNEQLNNAPDLENAVTSIIIPGGVYYLKDQIRIPPYLHFQMEGDAQFKCYIDLDPEGYFYGLKEGDTEYSRLDVANANASYEGTILPEEVLTTKSFIMSDGAVKSDGTETEPLCVYKKGVIKICYDLDENGYGKSPFKKKFFISPATFSPFIDGNGTLTLLNNKNITYYVNKEGTRKPGSAFNNNLDVAHKEGYYPIVYSPRYICGIEIGNSRENIAYDEAIGNHKSNLKGSISYANLRIGNVKFCYFGVGMLSHVYNCYSNEYRNMDFFQNTVGYQYGVYGEDEPKDSIDIFNAESNELENRIIWPEPSVDVGEMLHFDSCVFTGNFVDVNTMLSAGTHSFDKCHFDQSNCVFRSPYTSKSFLNHCHIEGIGQRFSDELKKDGRKYTSAKQTAFYNRKATPYSNYYGILYAKPHKMFNGSKNYSRDGNLLVIENSTLADNRYIPAPLITFAGSNKINNTPINDGHIHSKVVFRNVSSGTTTEYPVCYPTKTRTDEGIVCSSFIVSDYPESTTRLNAVIDTKDTLRWKTHGAFTDSYNGRFTSYRNLALKNPSFQNAELDIDYSNDQPEVSVSGMNIDISNLGICELVLNHNFIGSNPFFKYDSNAKYFKCDTALMDWNEFSFSEDGSDATALKPPSYEISLTEDLISCEKNDTISAALVTGYIPQGVVCQTNSDGTKPENPTEKKKVLNHTLCFTEYDDEGNELGRYDYIVTYPCNSLLLDANGNVDSTIDLMDSRYFPQTNICRHTVHNKKTSKVMLSAKISVPYIYGPESLIMEKYTSEAYSFILNAVLAEKNM